MKVQVCVQRELIVEEWVEVEIDDTLADNGTAWQEAKRVAESTSHPDTESLLAIARDKFPVVADRHPEAIAAVSVETGQHLYIPFGLGGK